MAGSTGPLAPRTVRVLVQVVCVAGIAGMIFGSVKDNNGIAITFGLVTAVSVLFLIVLTSVLGPAAFRPGASGALVDEAAAADLEDRIQALVAAGADEDAVRRLVSRALEVGQGR